MISRDSADTTPAEVVDQYKEVATLIYDIVRSEPWYSESACPLSELTSCVGRLYNNRFSVTSCQNSDIAIGTYPLAYLMNHRCIPNATFVFTGSQLHVRSTAAIAKGEEITVRIFTRC